jgi:hypothetical protein
LKLYAIINNQTKKIVSGDFGCGKCLSEDKDYLKTKLDFTQDESIIEFTAKVEK